MPVFGVFLRQKSGQIEKRCEDAGMKNEPQPTKAERKADRVSVSMPTDIILAAHEAAKAEMRPFSGYITRAVRDDLIRHGYLPGNDNDNEE